MMLPFVKPAPKPALVDLAQLLYPIYARLNARLQLQISKDDVRRLKKICRSRAVLCGNHSAHEDPVVAFGLSRAIGRQFAYATARELFLDYPNLPGLWLQSLGCYSVTRAAADIKAYRATVDLLRDGKMPVVIFPEGEISHQNGTLMELQPGPEQAAFAAIDKLADAMDILLVPFAILYRYHERIEEQLESTLERIEQHLGLSKVDRTSFQHRLRTCFQKHFQKIAVERHIQVNDPSDLSELLNAVRQDLINSVARIEHIPVMQYHTQLDQLHALRNMFCERRFSKGTHIEELPLESRFHYRNLKRATNLIAIGEHSFKSTLTQEEAAELVCILEHEIFRAVSLRDLKTAHVSVCEPISIREHLTQWRHNKADAIKSVKELLKTTLEQRIRELDAQFPSAFVFS